MINLEIFMLMLIISSIILIVIPAFLAILINKRIPLSPKFLSIGMIISILSYLLKTPPLNFLNDTSSIDVMLLGVIVFSFAESLIRIYTHNKFSHETKNNILSIAIGYVLLKFIAVFLSQFFNFIQIVATTTQAEPIKEITTGINANIFYLNQFFKSINIFLYNLMLVIFILIEHQNVKNFKIYEPLFFIINLIVLLLMTKITHSYFTIYFYFNIFLILLFVTSLIAIYQYSHVDTKKT